MGSVLDFFFSPGNAKLVGFGSSKKFKKIKPTRSAGVGSSFLAHQFLGSMVLDFIRPIGPASKANSKF